MGYEHDFIDETPVEFEIDGRKFKYKPTTGGDENSWLKEVLYNTAEGTKVDYGIYNKKKLLNLVEVPYDEETIEKAIGIRKNWSGLNEDHRFLLLSKLKPSLFDSITKKIREIDSGDATALKN